MRDLLVSIEMITWSEISALLFGILFVILTVWVFLPERKSEYARVAKLPLQKD